MSAYESTIALGNLGGAQSLAALVQIMLGEDETRPAGMALKRMGAEILPEIEKLATHPSPHIRLLVMDLAAGLGARSLLERFSNDEDPLVQEEFQFYWNDNSDRPLGLPPKT